MSKGSDLVQASVYAVAATRAFWDTLVASGRTPSRQEFTELGKLIKAQNTAINAELRYAMSGEWEKP